MNLSMHCVSKKIFSVPDLLGTAIVKFNKVYINSLRRLLIGQFEFSGTWHICQT